MAGRSVTEPSRPVSYRQLRGAVSSLGLLNRPVCIHASLRSFGAITGGADALIDTFLDEHCTIVVPTFSWEGFAVPPPDKTDMRPPRNGWNDSSPWEKPLGPPRIYDATSDTLDDDMGVLPARVLAHTVSVRGNHPLVSFAAVGPLAGVLIKAQDLTEPFAPLEALSERGGVVALMGVGLRRMTLLHLAEQQAGRTLLRRWALGQNRSATLVAVGGCSEGFDNFNSVLARIERQAQIGSSLWRVFEANLALEAATAAIVTKPSITHCRQLCVRCDDAVSGGPILD